jgi:CelD/BcsL family acetyltransferase involved in cellulose biosynthesis
MAQYVVGLPAYRHNIWCVLSENGQKLPKSSMEKGGKMFISLHTKLEESERAQFRRLCKSQGKSMYQVTQWLIRRWVREQRKQ